MEAKNPWNEEQHFRSDARKGSHKLLLALLRLQGMQIAPTRKKRKYPLRPVGPFPPNPIVWRIQKAVAQYYCFHESYLYLEGRSHWYSRPRQVAYYLAHTMGRVSLPEIGRHFDKDHTTVLFGCRQVKANQILLNDANRIAAKLAEARVERLAA